ncbi:hypothetical protein PVL29_025045 [Vitis rotundifolia]|nr:hypothetical protein PVL29_025045 [Vitis rotundifolia]
MKNVETICLDLSRSNEIWFTSKIFAQMKKVFAKMNKLRLLKIYYSHRCEYKMLLPKDFEFPSNLRYLHWEGLESLPLNFHGENLIAINLKSSNIKEFWAGNKCLAKLKFIDLSNSKQLIKMPKFSSMPNLERLNLEECTHLRQLHSSISAFPEMKFLRELNLSGSGIKEVPSSIGCFKSLEILDLSKCSKFEKFPDIIFVNMEHLRRLELSESGIKELPNNIGYLDSLKFLNLSGCLNFEKFPEIQGKMKHLEWLYLKKTAIKELPNSIGYLESLKALDLSGCSNFEKFPEIQGNMKHLERLSLADTAIKELPISFESLEALESLSLSRCSNFKKFPEIQKNMESLYFLYLNGTAIKELSCSMGHLPKLASLDLGNCKNLKSIQSNISELKSLHRYSLNGCSNLEAFSEITEDMEHLQLLHLRGMVIGELPSSIERLRGLTRLELSNCENLVSLPNTIGNLTCLHTLLVHNCSKLHKLPDNLRSLQRCLRILDLGGCNLMEGAIPSDLWCLFSLVSLNVSENNIRRIPTGIIHLAQLYTLRMNHCPMLEEIPKLPSSLRSIEAHGCPHLEALSSDPTHLLWSSLLNCFKSENQDFRCRRNPDRRLRSGIHIVIPGRSGIPEWISCESKGCEATINLPKNWYEDDSFLGFALSFQHLPLDNDNEYEIRHGLMDLEGSRHGYLQDGTLPQCLLSISHGEQSKHVANVTFDMNCKSYSVGGVAYDLHSYDTSSTSSTDPALLMAYFLQNTISSEYRSSGWNRLKARFGGTFRCGNKVAFKVESYGIHLIYDYAPDHHQQNENQGTSSLFFIP